MQECYVKCYWSCKMTYIQTRFRISVGLDSHGIKHTLTSNSTRISC